MGSRRSKVDLFLWIQNHVIIILATSARGQLGLIFEKIIAIILKNHMRKWAKLRFVLFVTKSWCARHCARVFFIKYSYFYTHTRPCAMIYYDGVLIAM